MKINNTNPPSIQDTIPNADANARLLHFENHFPINESDALPTTAGKNGTDMPTSESRLEHFENHYPINDDALPATGSDGQIYTPSYEQRLDHFENHFPINEPNN